MRACTIDGCDLAHIAKGMCVKHYRRATRHGSPDSMAVRKTVEERFAAKIEKTDSCWNWTGTIAWNGYGFLNIGGKMIRAHRHAFEVSKGDIPADLVVDHICRNRGCVRPDHLRLVTRGQNVENQDGHRDSESGRRGVTRQTGTGKWRAYASKNGKTYHGGSFVDLEEAAEAARQLRLRIHTHNTLDRMATK